MRTKLTRDESLSLLCQIDQIHAACVAEGNALPGDLQLISEAFKSSIVLAVPLLYARNGAAAVFSFVNDSRYKEAVASFYDKFMPYPPQDAEVCYSHFAAYLPPPEATNATS